MSSSTRTSAADLSLRMSQTLLLCTGVLCAILTLSYFFILPHITVVEVAGTERTPTGIREYQEQLQASLLGMEEQRRELILPVQDEQYRALVREKHGTSDLLLYWRSLRSAAAQALPESAESIVFSRLALEPQNGVLTVSGDVRNVGPRSMTVLAQFVNELRAQPWVKALPNPVYQRLSDAGIGTYSPFELRLTLQ